MAATASLSSTRGMNKSSRSKATALIEKARAEVSLFDVLDDFFDIRHPREGKSYKGDCPFRWEHPDGGADKGWRTYPASNTSYCFVTHGVLDGPRLISLRNDISLTEAAKFLLNHYGKLKPKPYRERMSELVEARAKTNLGEVSYLVEALQMAIETEAPGMEFDPDVQNAIEEELDSLEDVLGEVTEEGLAAWYVKARAHVLGTAKEAT